MFLKVKEVEVGGEDPYEDVNEDLLTITKEGPGKYAVFGEYVFSSCTAILRLLYLLRLSYHNLDVLILYCWTLILLRKLTENTN